MSNLCTQYMTAFFKELLLELQSFGEIFHKISPKTWEKLQYCYREICEEHLELIKNRENKGEKNWDVYLITIWELINFYLLFAKSANLFNVLSKIINISLNKLLSGFNEFNDQFTVGDLASWFDNKKKLFEINRDCVGFTIIRNFNIDHEVEIIIGIFNRKTSQVVVGRKVKTKKLDSQLTRYHSDSEVVVYD